jgi:ABC-type sugar transport system ATPase subunit
VALCGRPFTPRSPSHSIRAGLALLTNDRKATELVLNMGVDRNMTLAAMPRFSPGGWVIRARERTAADRQRAAFDIRLASLEQPVESLSGGNQQKVALAKWLETEPAVLLLDEPTRGVDVGAKHEIYGLMNAWTEAGIAIVLITSEMPELLALSDRIIVMHRGRVTAAFEGDAATQEAILDAAMGEAARA